MPGVFLSVFELHNQHFPTQRLRKWLSPISRLEELKSGGVPLGQVHITMPNESASVLAQRSKEVPVMPEIARFNDVFWKKYAESGGIPEIVASAEDNKSIVTKGRGVAKKQMKVANELNTKILITCLLVGFGTW